MLSDSIISSYNKSRRFTDKSVVCHAPFTNLNFEQNGNITACCYNRRDVLGKYPANKIIDAWTGDAAKFLRQYIAENKLEGGCSVCNELLVAGNYAGTKSKMYDEYVNPKWFNSITGKSTDKNEITLPKVFEFELSNTCNLACTMCSGYFSSTIRKNKEKLEPLKMVYDNQFVKDVSTFIPTLTDMKFLGGEPFLIDIYYDIWDEIVKINSNVKVHITTNATILNNRAKQLLDKLNVGIILSIDSLNKETYEKIRIGANFERVLENLFYFKKLTEQKNTYLSIAACPMISNWQDLPQLLSFCNEHHIFLHFNVVWSPEELSLNNLSMQELKKVIDFLEEKNTSISILNRYKIKNKKVYTDLIETLKYWLAEKENYAIKFSITKTKFYSWQQNEYNFALEKQDELFIKMLTGILFFAFKDENKYSFVWGNSFSDFNEYKNNKEFLLSLKNEIDIIFFNKTFLDVISFLYQNLFENNINDNFYAKIEMIKALLLTSNKQKEIALDFTETLPLTQINNIENNSIEALIKILDAKYF